ncbi:hypothetical protein SRHO_G00190310 [Serrasalmus rhombeus]
MLTGSVRALNVSPEPFAFHAATFAGWQTIFMNASVSERNHCRTAAHQLGGKGKDAIPMQAPEGPSGRVIRDVLSVGHRPACAWVDEHCLPQALLHGLWLRMKNEEEAPPSFALPSWPSKGKQELFSHGRS